MTSNKKHSYPFEVQVYFDTDTIDGIEARKEFYKKLAAIPELSQIVVSHSYVAREYKCCCGKKIEDH